MARFQRLGSAIVLLRERAGLSQKELADRAGITAAMLSNYETGAKAPSLKSFERVLDALDVYLGSLDDALDVVNSRPVRSRTAPSTSAEPIEGVDLARFLGTEAKDLPPRATNAIIELILGFRRAARMLLRSEGRPRRKQKPPRDRPPEA